MEIQEEQTISISDMQWTYYSLETGKEVGKSDFGDDTADEQWYQRTDWDIAICGELLRTNSGTSGIGNGGIIAIDEAYESVSIAPDTTYSVDSRVE